MSTISSAIGTNSYCEGFVNHHVNIIINDVIYPVKVTLHDGVTDIFRSYLGGNEIDDSKTNPHFSAVKITDESLNTLPDLKNTDKIGWTWRLTYDQQNCGSVLVKESIDGKFFEFTESMINPFYNQFKSIHALKKLKNKEDNNCYLWRISVLILNESKVNIKSIILPLLGENTKNELFQVSNWFGKFEFDIKIENNHKDNQNNQNKLVKLIPPTKDKFHEKSVNFHFMNNRSNFFGHQSPDSLFELPMAFQYKNIDNVNPNVSTILTLQADDQIIYQLKSIPTWNDICTKEFEQKFIDSYHKSIAEWQKKYDGEAPCYHREIIVIPHQIISKIISTDQIENKIINVKYTFFMELSKKGTEILLSNYHSYANHHIYLEGIEISNLSTEVLQNKIRQGKNKQE